MLAIISLCLLVLPGNGWAGAWTSSSNFAYSAMGQSSTGFSKAAGTALFFDLQRQVFSQWHVGLRTTAIGAQSNHAHLYRLGAGPIIRFSFWSHWAIKLSAAIFNESANKSGDELYRSRGHSLQLGWERAMNISQVVSLAWGGFIGKHWGNLQRTESVYSVSSSRNIGDYRGLQVSIRITL